MKITVFNDLDTLYKKSADRFVDLAEKSIKNHGRFVVALSGGSSPKAIFKLLASEEYADKIEWSKVFFFLGRRKMGSAE